MAGTKVAELVASLRLDAKNFSSALKESESKLTKFGASAQKAGMKMTMGLTLPIAGAAAGAIKAATNFETSMTKIQSMVGLSAATVKGFENDVLRLAGETAQAPKELADAMFFITSAGLRGATAVEALEASAKAAAIGMGEAEVIADAVTNAINGYGAANITAAEATDILAKTVEQGKASAEDLAPQFGRLIPMAAELGISFDQVGGGLAFLTRASGNASQSTSSLRGILRTLIKPSQMARQTLEDVGMSVEDLRSAADDDLLGALIEMRETLEANGKEMGAVFEDSEALAGALQLTGQAAAEAAGVMDEMTRAAGTLDRGMGAVQEIAGFKMQQAMNDLKIIMIDLGQKLIPIVVPLIQQLAGFIKDLADKFNNLSPFMQKTVIALAGIAAAAGPALMAIGSISKGLGALSKVGTGVTGMLTGGGGLATGLATTAAKLGMSTGGLGFAAVGAAAVIGGALFLAFKANREEAQRNKDRLEDLQTVMISSGDASTILTTDIDKLTERLLALGDALEEDEETIDDFNGRMTLLGELMRRDVRDVFNEFITDMDHHNAAMEAGSDVYDQMADSVQMVTGLEWQNVEMLEKHRAALGADADAMIEAVENGDLQAKQLRDILEALDKTADAYDNNRAELEKTGEEYFKNEKNVLAYEDALNAGQLALVNNLIAEGDHATALEKVIGYTASLEGRQVRLAAVEAAAAEAAAEAAGEVDLLAGAQSEAAEETTELGLRVAEMNAAIEAGEDPLGRMAYQLAEITAQAAGADQALLAFVRENTDEAKNRAHWESVANQNRADALAIETRFNNLAGEINSELSDQVAAVRERVASEEISHSTGTQILTGLKRQSDELEEAERVLIEQKRILQDQKDALQANINVQEEALENAEAHLAALEAQAEAAKKPVQALKDRAAAEREGFDALRGMWQAQNDLNDAIETQQGLVDEIALVTAGEGDAIEEATRAWEQQEAVVQDLADEMDDLNDQILDAEARKLDLLAKEGEFQRGLTRELNSQKLAYFDIAAQVAELEDRQAELSEGALDAQRGLVDSLKAQQAAVTEVEQALIDLGIVSAADAAQANISAKQAKNLIKLRDEMEDTQAAFEAGEATTLDLIDAQDDYTKAVKDARRPIDRLERATDDLARMEKDAERIGLELAVARDKLTVVTEDKAKAEDTAARTSEAVAEIDAELISLEEKLAEVTKAETEARDEANKMKDMSAIQDAELIRLNKELEVANWDLVAAQYGVRDAEIALAEAGDKVNDAISRMRPLSEELADEMEVLSDVARLTYPEFDTMRATLAVLEPQIASARSAVDGFKDAIAALVRQMAILNGTRINPIQIPKVPPLMGQPSGDGGGDGGGFQPGIVDAIDDVVEAVVDVVDAVDEVVDAVNDVVEVVEPGGALLDGDEFAALVDATVVDNADAILGIQEAAALNDFLENIDTYMADIPEMPVYMPTVATPSTYGSIGGPGSRGGDIPSSIVTPVLTDAELARIAGIFPSAQSGGFVTSAGLVNVHAGETISPRGGGVNVVVNVEGSVSSERDLVEAIRKGLLRAQQSGKAVVL